MQPPWTLKEIKKNRIELLENWLSGLVDMPTHFRPRWKSEEMGDLRFPYLQMQPLYSSLCDAEPPYCMDGAMILPRSFRKEYLIPKTPRVIFQPESVEIWINEVYMMSFWKTCYQRFTDEQSAQLAYLGL